MMAAMLQLYAKLGATLDRLNDAVDDRLAPLQQQLSDATDKLLDKITGGDEAPPAPKDDNSQANLNNPTPEPDAEIQASPVSQAAPLTPFPDTLKPLQVIDTSGYDQTVSPTQNSNNDSGQV